MQGLTLFLVERYLPGLRPGQVDELGRCLHRAAAELRREGRSVEWLRSVALVDDETCLCTFAAASIAEVVEANLRAGAAYERIVEAIHAENPAPTVV